MSNSYNAFPYVSMWFKILLSNNQLLFPPILLNLKIKVSIK